MAPSDRIRLGVVGVGARGGGNLSAFLKLEPAVEVVAVCDVDSSRLEKHRERVERFTGRKCAAYSDYRHIIDDNTIDAVVISTPDHWHALPAVDACLADKDVYCEKPLTLTIAEGQAMVAAARMKNRIVQTGSQQRSDNRFRLACELVRSGRLGRIHTVKAGISRVNFPPPGVPDTAPPPELNYDLWLGPAPKRPYNSKRSHYNFRFFWDYAGGQVTNWGAHQIDIAQWGLGTDDSGPVRISAKSRANADGWYDVPEWCDIVYEYADGRKILCGQDYRGGATFEGENGTIRVDRHKIESHPKDIALEPLTDSDVRLYESANHYQDWVDCIRSRKLPICDVAIGHRTASVCHLGNIAIRTNREVRWDPVSEKILDDEEQSALLSRPYRQPWNLRA